MAKVDIVVPCYNYARFLEACVESALNQSVSDVRVLIIDDASSDGSIEVAKRLVKRDSRVTLIAHSVNRGHIATYNEGIDWAASDYFLLLSADDLLVAGALQRAVDIMDANHDVVLTYGECVAWFDTDPLPTIASVDRYRWETCDLLGEICASGSNSVPTPTAISRTSAQKAVGGYRKSLPHSGDMEMWLRFAAKGSIARIKAIQAIYRKHSTAMSNAYFSAILADFRQRQLAFDTFFDEHGARLDVSRNFRDTAHRALANEAFRYGVSSIRRGRVKEGVRLMRFAMDLDRSLRRLPPLWRLVKLPGPAGRTWATSALRKVGRKLAGSSGGVWRRARSIRGIVGDEGANGHS